MKRAVIYINENIIIPTRDALAMRSIFRRVGTRWNIDNRRTTDNILDESVVIEKKNDPDQYILYTTDKDKKNILIFLLFS